MDDGQASGTISFTTEFLGDDNYLEATGDGAAIWGHARNAAVRGVENAFRADLAGVGVPAPATDCPAALGNADIYVYAMEFPVSAPAPASRDLRMIGMGQVGNFGQVLHLPFLPGAAPQAQRSTCSLPDESIPRETAGTSR